MPWLRSPFSGRITYPVTVGWGNPTAMPPVSAPAIFLTCAPAPFLLSCGSRQAPAGGQEESVTIHALKSPPRPQGNSFLPGNRTCSSV